VQESRPSEGISPASQAEHVSPDFETSPVGQLSQLDSDVDAASDDLPAGQFVQLPALRPAHLPAGQVEHSDDPLPCDCVPAAQSPHPSHPLFEYVPAAQSLQSL
jgi:hypothetical protein